MSFLDLNSLNQNPDPGTVRYLLYWIRTDPDFYEIFYLQIYNRKIVPTTYQNPSYIYVFLTPKKTFSIQIKK